MPRKSVKADKSLYQVVREEELGLTRAQASELLGGLSESQIEKIENGKTPATPDDVMLMAKAYKKPELCNHYCSKVCPIGRKYVPEVKAKEGIVLPVSKCRRRAKTGHTLKGKSASVISATLIA